DQPRVLHRNDRLRREILQQSDLLFIEWADYLPLGADIAEQCAVLTQWDGEQGADAGNLPSRMLHRMLVVRTGCPRVGVLKKPFPAQQPVEHLGESKSPARQLLVLLRISAGGDGAQPVAVAQH